MTITAAKPADYIYVHIWLTLFGVMLFGFFVAHDMNFIQLMLQTDSSYLSGVSLLVFFVASMYAFFHIVQNSRMIAEAEAAGSKKLRSEANLLGQYLIERSQAQTRPGKMDEPPAPVIEIYADRLRAPVELGWFVIDLLIKLGLIGTIIGFIMILLSLTTGPLPGASDIQKLLTTLGGGMGTALYTTLAGLVTASLLAMQYILLGRCVERLIGVMIRLDSGKQSR